MLHTMVAGDGGFAPGPHDHHADHQAGRHRVDGAQKRRVPTVVLSILLAVGALGTVAWMTLTNPDRRADPALVAAPPPPAPREVEDWIRANVPSGSRLLTDGAAAPTGYPTSSLSDAGNWHDFDYLLTTQTGTPSPDAAAAPVWPSSSPVALFDGVEVRHIAPEADKDPFDPAAELAQRKRAGEALLTNPHIEVSTAARTALEHGDLDLRAAAVLSGLASQFDLALQDLARVPVEAAAGTPVRELTIYTADTAVAMRNINAFDPALKPDRVVVLEFGAISLHWPLSFSPIPSVK